MLDNETISELKVLENPKLSHIVKRALDEDEFLNALLENAGSDDWLLRWGISTILVQVSKRKPALLKGSIPIIQSRLSNENKRMVRDNIAQSLLHLSKGIPEDFISNGSAQNFLAFLGSGEDHERFDAIQVMGNIVGIEPEFVKTHLDDIDASVCGIDNPVVKGHAERVLAGIRSSL